MTLVRLVGDYRPEFIRGDVAAGVAVAALMVPHGMAYAELAGVPAVTGLYTTIVAVLAYAVVGPSRVLLLGPDSSLAPLIAAAIALTASDADPATAIAIASILALMTGALCILAGIARLGSIAELLSRPVQLGYLNGLAIVMIVSQISKLAGFPSVGDMPVEQLAEFADEVTSGAIVPTALAVGLGALLSMLVLGRVWPAVPAVLVATAGSIVVVRAFGLVDHRIDVVGEIPSGLPVPAMPSVDVSTLPSLALASVGLAWVTLSDTTALSRGFADRSGQRVDPNTEIIALGVANATAGVFGGFPVSASTSRTATSLSSGGRTQLVGVISAGLVLVVLIAGRELIEFLPATTLAAIVIAAAIHLFDARQVRWLHGVRRSEFWLCIGATIAVLLLGILSGLAVAVGLSLADFIRRVWRPYDAVLGRMDGRKGYHDRGRHADARQIPGLVLFRFDAPLFFANADHFERRVHDVIGAAPSPVRRIVFAAEPITDIDTSSAAMLTTLLADLRERDIEIAFAELKGPVKDRLQRYELYDQIGGARFHPTIDQAVSSYLRDHGVEWTNWDER